MTRGGGALGCSWSLNYNATPRLASPEETQQGLIAVMKARGPKAIVICQTSEKGRTAVDCKVRLTNILRLHNPYRVLHVPEQVAGARASFMRMNFFGNNKESK